MLDPKSEIPYVLLTENFKNVRRNATTRVSEIPKIYYIFSCSTLFELWRFINRTSVSRRWSYECSCCIISLNISLSNATVLVCLWGLEFIYMVLSIGDYGLCEHSLFFFALVSQHHSINIFNRVPVLCWSLCLHCDFYNWTNIPRKIQLGCVLLS